MKVFILTTGFLTFFSVLGLKLFFVFSPAPPISLKESISDIIPKEINGWSYADYDLASSDESSDRIPLRGFLMIICKHWMGFQFKPQLSVRYSIIRLAKMIT